MADEPTTPEGGTPDAAQVPAPATKTFTQDDVDRLVRDRLTRQKQQFSDYDELKARAQKLDEIENERKSEAEKLLGAVDRYKSEAQTASEREKAAIEKANSTLKRAAVIAEAARLQTVDPDAVYALLNKDSLTIGDGDQVEGVSDAVTALLAERPYLAGGPRSSGGFDGGARQTAPAVTSAADFNAQLRKEAGFA